ncbi:helix-turn-helix domain-containing protein [Streptomyces fradiae]|uniref:transcriptional regulator n=1 Tax=Streptomyces fradiae TaxID=1906 RepID=UPI0034050B9A
MASGMDGFAGALRRLKERSGLSYGVLAGRAHMSASTLHRYCNGDAVPTRFAPVERLARLCGASRDEMVALHRAWIVADEDRRRSRAAGPERPAAGVPSGAGLSSGAGSASGTGASSGTGAPSTRDADAGTEVPSGTGGAPSAGAAGAGTATPEAPAPGEGAPPHRPGDVTHAGTGPGTRPDSGTAPGSETGGAEPPVTAPQVPHRTGSDRSGGHPAGGPAAADRPAEGRSDADRPEGGAVGGDRLDSGHPGTDRPEGHPPATDQSRPSGPPTEQPRPSRSSTDQSSTDQPESGSPAALRPEPDRPSPDQRGPDQRGPDQPGTGRVRRRVRIAAAAAAVALTATAAALALTLHPGTDKGAAAIDDGRPVALSQAPGPARPAGTPSPSPFPSLSPSTAAPTTAPTASADRAGPAPSRAAGPAGGVAERRRGGAPLTVDVRPYVWTHPCDQAYVVDRPADRMPPPPSEQGARNWITGLGGAPGENVLTELAVQGTGEEAVVLHALRVRVVDRAAPLPGNAYWMGVGCGGEMTPMGLDINLDAAQPRVVPVAGRQGDRVIPASDFPYKVSATDPQVLKVTAHTAGHSVRWYLELEWSSGGRQGTLRIDDRGRPFEVSALTGRPQYGYPLGGTEWLPMDG